MKRIVGTFLFEIAHSVFLSLCSSDFTKLKNYIFRGENRKKREGKRCNSAYRSVWDTYLKSVHFVPIAKEGCDFGCLKKYAEGISASVFFLAF